MNPIIITADRLWDGTADRTRPVLRIVGAQVEHVDEQSAPPDAHHFPGCTILPGLIDTHVHLVMSAQATNEAIIAQVTSETDEQLLARAQANAQAALRAGLTTVRDCGGTKNLVQQL